MRASELSRRARNLEYPESLTSLLQHQVGPDDWYAGFASALACVWRLHHDGQMVRHVMSSTGIQLKHLEDSGVDEFDLMAIRSALAGSKK